MLLTNPDHRRLRAATTWLLVNPLWLAVASIPLSLSAAVRAPLWVPIAGLALAATSMVLTVAGPAWTARAPSALDPRTRQRIYNRLRHHPPTAGAPYPDLAWMGLATLGARADRGALHRAAWRYSLAELTCDATLLVYLGGPGSVSDRDEYHLARDELHAAADALAGCAVETLATTDLPATAARLATELASGATDGDGGGLTAEQITDVLALDHPGVSAAQVATYLDRRRTVELVVRQHLLALR